jgi:Uma2 family endonuclease
MLPTTARPVTRHEYVLIPEGAPRQELIEGDLVMAPSPTTPHQHIAGRIYSTLLRYLDDHPIGQVFIAPLDVYLSDVNVFQPDVLFVAKENASIIEEHGIEGAPDLVVEVLSKSTARFDLGPKLSIYRRTGVEEFWVIDPAKRTLAVYRFDRQPDTPVSTWKARQKFSSELFPGLTIDLAVVFAHA